MSIKNNNILHSLKQTLNLSDDKILEIFKNVDDSLDSTINLSYFKPQSDSKFEVCENEALIQFFRWVDHR